MIRTSAFQHALHAVAAEDVDGFRCPDADVTAGADVLAAVACLRAGGADPADF